MRGDEASGTGRPEGARELLRRMLPRELELHGTPEDMRAFYAHRRPEDLRNVRAVMLLVSLLCFLWWPTDPWFFHHDANVVRAFFVARAASTVTALALYLISPRIAWLAARPWLVAFVGAVIVCGVGGYELGRLGGPGTFWFAFLHAILLAPALLSMRPATRIAMTLAMGATAVAGYYGMHPEHLSAPMTVPSLSFFVFVLVVAILGGMFADRLRHDAFILLRTTEKYALQIKSLNAHLGDRVREQTAALRALTDHVQRTRERERTHVARELHDAIGQELTSLQGALAAARAGLERDPASIGGKLDEIDGLIQRATASTRALVTDPHPRVLDDLGLGAAAEDLVEQTRARTGLACNLSLPTDGLRAPDDISIVAFGILQESLTNVAQHAQASRIDVILAVDEGVLSLVVADDGRGVATEEATAASAGLAGMRERATAAGGELTIDSTPGVGTTLEVRLPTAPARTGSA